MSTESWPSWARAQLLAAVALAPSVPTGQVLATALYERWFATAVAPASHPRPLLGEYRRAHAGVAETMIDGLPVLDRHDHLGRDGWWRTWNTTWRPRADGTRVLLSPNAVDAAEVVGRLTGLLRDGPYLLSAPTAPARLERSGAVVLYLPHLAALTPPLVDALAPLLRPDTPPLCLPVAPGVAVAEYPGNGMTFGEHRCHLVALALARSRRGDSLDAIADVFTAHGVDPAAPYRTARIPT